MDFTRDIERLFRRTRMKDHLNAKAITAAALEAGYPDDVIMAMLYAAGSIESYDRMNRALCDLRHENKTLRRQLSEKATNKNLNVILSALREMDFPVDEQEAASDESMVSGVQHGGVAEST